jgi:aldehyde:ferredoxin oxidoreductase
VLAAPTQQVVEHAPTVTQCQADQALWLSKLVDPHGTDDVSYKMLYKWAIDLERCAAVDSRNRSKYFNTEAEAQASQLRRMYHFIYRHGLLNQFISEDEAGQR